MEIVLLWFVFSIIAGVIAGNKGRSFIGFFLLALVLSPIVGVLIAAVISPNIASVEAEKVRGGDMRKCPYCAELIRTEAIKCRYCASEIAVQPVDENARTYALAKAFAEKMRGKPESETTTSKL